MFVKKRADKLSSHVQCCPSRQARSGGPSSAAIRDAIEAKGAAAAAAERIRPKGALPCAVRDLDRALGDASPTRIAAVGEELPQVHHSPKVNLPGVAC